MWSGTIRSGQIKRQSQLISVEIDSIDSDTQLVYLQNGISRGAIILKWNEKLWKLLRGPPTRPVAALAAQKLASKGQLATVYDRKKAQITK